MRYLGTTVLGFLLAATPAGYAHAANGPDAGAAAVATTSQALLAAIRNDDLQQARQIVEADPKLLVVRGPDDGEFPLHHCRSVAMADLLIKAGADPNATNRRHNARPVRWAASDWRPELVKFLEEKAGPDPDPFYMAATGKANELARAIMEQPDRLDTRSAPNDILGGSRHLMHIAATAGQTACLKVLIDAGADVNEGGGWSNAEPLEAAAWAGYPDAVKLLIEHGADVNARCDTGHTALWYAAITGRREVVDILLKAGAKVEDGLILAVHETARGPYYGRELPKREDYNAVIELLKAAGGK